jgi:hypothetical protein
VDVRADDVLDAVGHQPVAQLRAVAAERELDGPAGERLAGRVLTGAQQRRHELHRREHQPVLEPFDEHDGLLCARCGWDEAEGTSLVLDCVPWCKECSGG